jgi:hypothetical protein
MIVNDSKKSQKVAQLLYCETCHYTSCKKSDYSKHLSTIKHKNNKMVVNDSEKSQKVANFECECGKIYKYDSGYYRHKKKCNKPNICNDICHEVSNKNETIDKELIMLLIKENSELKNMMMKVIENGTNNITTNYSHNNISNNKTFNLQFFLNETCKDAMNIMDFVESIELQLSDLERVGEVGYIEGISNIIIKNLKNLDITQRPVHCTDKKRETLYVKDDNKWEKDDANIKMHKMIRKVQDKNFRLIKKFKEKYPYYNKASSKQSDVYNNIIIESMGGKGDNDYEKEEKIIKKVSREVLVEK